MNITHISVSRKSVWDQCKKAYYYKYHIKQEVDVEEPIYFVYGKIVHKIAEEFVKARGIKTIDEVRDDVLQHRVPIESYEGVEEFAPAIPHEYKMKLPEHLASVRKITEQIGFDGELEWPFEFDLDPPHDKKVVGFIDRLIRKDDKFWILDYKTTKKGPYRKDENTIKYDLQLQSYARVVQKTFNVPAENIKAALLYLDGGNLIGARFSDAQLLGAEKELLKAYNHIKECPPEQAWGTVGHHCKRCDYRQICPHVKGTRFSK